MKDADSWTRSLFMHSVYVVNPRNWSKMAETREVTSPAFSYINTHYAIGGWLCSRTTLAFGSRWRRVASFTHFPPYTILSSMEHSKYHGRILISKKYLLWIKTRTDKTNIEFHNAQNRRRRVNRKVWHQEEHRSSAGCRVQKEGVSEHGQTPNRQTSYFLTLRLIFSRRLYQGYRLEGNMQHGERKNNFIS